MLIVYCEQSLLPQELRHAGCCLRVGICIRDVGYQGARIWIWNCWLTGRTGHGIERPMVSGTGLTKAYEYLAGTSWGLD